jgi:foldase protein PrsA
MKKIVSLILTLVLVSSVLVGFTNNTSFNENVTALVNDKEVKLDEVTVYLRELESLFEKEYGLNIWDMNDVEGKSTIDIVKEAAVDVAIRDIIINEVAIKKGITVTEEEKSEIDVQVKQYFEQMDKKKLNDSNITPEMIKKTFVSNKINSKLMEAELKDFKLEKEKIKEGIINGNYVSPMDSKMYERIQKLGYKGASEKVIASHILIGTRYNKDKAEMKERAEEVLEKAKSGVDFGKLAKEYSDDVGTASQGGNLGEFSRGVMVAPFEEACFKLKVGEISDIVESIYGYHIIKLEEKINATEKEIQQMKDLEQLIEKQAIQYEKEIAFTNLYNTWKKDYNIQINKELLSKVKVNQSRKATTKQ